VVNKLDTIDSQFRFFKMELLAGDPEYVVEHVRLAFVFVRVLIFASTKRIVVSRLTSPKSIGTRDSIPNMSDSFRYSIRKMSSPMFLLVSVRLLYPQPKKGAQY
jgi:hypothetical protein